MARKFRTWEEAGSALLNYGQLAITLADIECAYMQRSAEIKAEHEARVTAIEVEQTFILTQIEAFAEEHKDEIVVDGAKSRKLRWGVIGWRASHALKRAKKKTIEYVVKQLKALKLGHCIVSKETYDKEAVKRLSAEQIKAVGCYIDDRENFFADPDLVTIGDYKPAA